MSAKNSDRIAWVFYSKGERNVWTAAAPDFKPVNLTGFLRDEVFEIPDIYITDDGKTVVFIKGGRPNSEGWVTNSRSDPDGMEQAIWAVRTDTGQLWRVAPGRNPVLSPDGRWLLLVKEGLIYRAPLIPPSNPESIQEPEILFRAAGQNGSPRWSPNSNQVAFVTRRNDHSYIGVFDIEQRKITWIAPKEKAGLYMGTNFLAVMVGGLSSGVYTWLSGKFNDAGHSDYVWYTLAAHLVVAILVLNLFTRLAGEFTEREE